LPFFHIFTNLFTIQPGGSSIFSISLHLENAEGNSVKIRKIRKKCTLNCEMIWKIWKKPKLNSEKIWKIWKKSQVE
jgi:hypothetical protein